MRKTQSGLIVPDHIETRKRETWPRDDGMLLRRFVKLCDSRDVGLAFICRVCEKEKRPSVGWIVPDPETNEVWIECQCTRRRLDKVVM